MRTKLVGVVAGVAAVMCSMAVAGAAGGKDAYYTEEHVYWSRPNPGGEMNLGDIGVTGLKVRIDKGVVVKVVETVPGTPAEGQFKAGQIIVGINGAALKGKNPVVALGSALTQAEATDGKMIFDVQDADDAPAKKVTVTIPVLGSYSKTWPLQCAKSAKIIKQAADWGGAAWIGPVTNKPGGKDLPPEVRKAGDGTKAVYLRREFAVAKGVRSATVTVCGLGLYELFLNGNKVGDRAMAPAMGNIKNDVHYNTYDVTDGLVASSNAIGVILGNGYPVKFAGQIGEPGYPRLLLNLHLEYSDGTSGDVNSDGSWIGPGFKGLALEENRQFLKKWRDWASKNYSYLKVKRDLFDCPGEAALDGSAHLIKDRGFLFLFAVGKQPARASIPLNRLLQLEEDARALYQLTEVYPREGTDLGIYRYGEIFKYDVPPDAAVILSVSPAPAGATAPRRNPAVQAEKVLEIGAFVLKNTE